ncbi:hypothetical protein PGB90_000952 [Kerria lacca]
MDYYGARCIHIRKIIRIVCYYCRRSNRIIQRKFHAHVNAYDRSNDGYAFSVNECE